MSDGEESPFGDVRSRVEMEVEEYLLFAAAI